MKNKEISVMAKRLVSRYFMQPQKGSPYRGEFRDMVTSYAPEIAKRVKSFVADEVSSRYDVNINGNDVKKYESHYYAFRDEEKNSNKYHYVAVYSCEVNGADIFAPIDVYGRIGEVKKVQLIGEITESLNFAKQNMNKYISRKTAPSKGYQEITLRIGSRA